eukprot:TRINITY_DN2429_c0_g4_i2.p1 TRINITY_DN2429_c0_g4~~TRINITY_DN2429_c0_g4_i2.p1  ORF type:complete len:222 (+),score=50.55 TRINITY_DN2429_c0_g4_i2:115-780(+)
MEKDTELVQHCRLDESNFATTDTSVGGSPKADDTDSCSDNAVSKENSLGSNARGFHYRHPQVPKPTDMAGKYDSFNGRPTTVMLRNIPNRWSHADIMEELEDAGFGGTFDFLYSPLDKGSLLNVGYAFLNFVDPDVSERFMQVFQNRRCKTIIRQRKIRGKAVSVAVAHLQGLKANLEHYEKSVVNSPKLRNHRPVVIANIALSFGDLAPSESQPQQLVPR